MPAESAKRIATIAVLAASCPGILALDLFVVPWQMPTPVLYAIPVLLAARFLGRPATVVLLALALYVQMVDAMLEGADFAVTILAVSSLALIGGIGVLWGDAHARVAQFYELEQERAAELEESRRQLLRFFALVAHDLRGPVTAIRGYSQLLSRADTADEVRQTRIARGVDSATRQLTRLTDDVFEASRVGSGQLELRTSDWDLQLLADEIVEQRRVSAPTHRLVLETTLSVAGAGDDPLSG